MTTKEVKTDRAVKDYIDNRFKELCEAAAELMSCPDNYIPFRLLSGANFSYDELTLSDKKYWQKKMFEFRRELQVIGNEEDFRVFFIVALTHQTEFDSYLLTVSSDTDYCNIKAIYEIDVYSELTNELDIKFSALPKSFQEWEEKGIVWQFGKDNWVIDRHGNPCTEFKCGIYTQNLPKEACLLESSTAIQAILNEADFTSDHGSYKNIEGTLFKTTNNVFVGHFEDSTDF